MVVHAIGRIRHHEVRADAGQSQADSFGIGAVAADEAVLPHDPDVADAACCLFRGLWHLVRVGQPAETAA
jgi:hypothetical protein